MIAIENRKLTDVLIGAELTRENTNVAEILVKYA
jgi:hypothetical protein